jgi:hypothetical protein
MVINLTNGELVKELERSIVRVVTRAGRHGVLTTYDPVNDEWMVLSLGSEVPYKRGDFEIEIIEPRG